MMIAMVERCTRIIGRAQGFLGLPIRDETEHCPTLGYNVPRMVTAWEPDPDELQRLVNGARIHVSIYGVSHPPITLYVGEVPLDSPEATG